MPTTSPFIVGVALLATALLGACSSDGDDAADVSCDQIVVQASYETMRQLAGAGLAADPAALRAALPGEERPSDDDVVTLPEYRILVEQFDDAERATLLSALSSTSTGVGDVFDQAAFYRATSSTGGCAGWVDEL